MTVAAVTQLVGTIPVFVTAGAVTKIAKYSLGQPPRRRKAKSRGRRDKLGMRSPLY